ncbi:DUF4258 domain-containing protein [Planctomycetota bacterium]
MDKAAWIRERVQRDLEDPGSHEVRWSAHAVREILNDGLTGREVEKALLQCELVEDYPTETRPLPDCLVLGRLRDGRPVHVVVALDEVRARILVVTVYIPSGGYWHADWQTRRRGE